MKTANDNKEFSRHLQLPLGFNKTDPGDNKRMLAFLDDRPSSEPPVSLLHVFSRFSGQPDAWSGARIARTISSLFSERMISCVMKGNTSLPLRSSVFLETPDQWGRIQVIARKRLPSGELQAVVGICRMAFGAGCPLEQDDLLHFLDSRMKERKALLTAFGRMADSGRYPGAADIGFCLDFIRTWTATVDPYEKICAVRDGKAAMMLFSSSFSRLKDFYENWSARWESWQKSIERFTAFQAEIEGDPEAAASLSRLRHVIEMQHPWEDLDGMDDLIARINPVFERIQDDRLSALQHDTLFQINRMIETISKLLDDSHARDEIRNMALVELQKIKMVMSREKPGSHISRQREIAEEAFEKAQDIVFFQS